MRGEAHSTLSITFQIKLRKGGINMAEIELKRVNIRIPAEVKEWYEKQAERMCISLTGVMAMTLIEKYDREQNGYF